MNRTVRKVFYTVLPLIMFLFATIMIVGIFAATTASVNVDMQMGYEISKGTGTLADPYIIEGVGVNSSSAGVGTFNYYARNNMFTAGNYFKQTMDLEVSDGDLYYTNLEGIYNGNGHTITFSQQSQPLFNLITGTLKNLKVVASGGNVTAGICSQLGNDCNTASVMDNVLFYGEIYDTSTSSVPVGGLVAKAIPPVVIKNCGNYANINSDYSSCMGGILGVIQGGTGDVEIINCFNQGIVRANNLSGSSTTNSCYVGGICGASSGATGMATLTNCYNTGYLKIGNDTLAGLVGSTNSIAFKNCYVYSSNINGSAVYSFYSSTGASTTSTASAMQTKSTYSGWTFGTYGQATDGWVWADAEILIDGETQSLALPRLWFETLKLTTQTDYTIASAADLNKYATSEYFGNESYTFTQTADITTSSSPTQTDLAANYDGNGHTIKFTGPTSNSLFGTVSGKVSNLNVTVANSSASAICSDLNGTLERIVVRGAISGSGNIGGLASTIACSSRTSIKAKIYQCANYATVESTSGGNAGGIVGFATSSAGTDVVGITYGAYIVDCANYGAITQSGSDSTLSAGGIVGRLNGELLEITNCYNGSDISAYAYAGGILGSVAGTTNVSNEDIKNCVSLASSLSTSYMKGAVGGIVGYSKTADSDIKYLSVFCTAATQYGNGGNTSSTAPYLGATAVQMQKQNIYSASSSGSSTSTSITGFTFGIKGTATSGWVWDDKKVISMDGMEATVKLPGLAWEYL